VEDVAQLHGRDLLHAMDQQALELTRGSKIHG
jgi:hypothetical protein